MELNQKQLTQKDQVKSWLLSGRPITGLQALAMYNCYRLSSIIHRLRDEGLKIETDLIPTKDGKSHFASYKLKTVER